jgi:predicted kinase
VLREAAVVLLNGVAGVGKTTVARRLAAHARNGACIHGDDLRNFVVTRHDAEVELGLGYVNAASVASNFLRGGYDLVVVDYVFEAPRHVKRFRDGLTVDVPVTLVALTRDGFPALLPDESDLVVDLSGLDPDAAAAMIVESVRR